MRFLNPKTDYAFKKIFGSEASQDILISFLNAILDLRGPDLIVEVTILDPRLAPKIEGMKDTYLDVRVRDQCGRSYIVEMQVLNVEGFEKRVLYNACKAYVNQLGKGDPYHILTEVVAVTVTDFEMFPSLGRVISRFRLRADENPAICHQDLELVFAELPKFSKTEAELSTTLDRWLYFLKTARDLTAIPHALALDPAIVHAFELANRGGWTDEELDYVETRERWIADQQYIHKRTLAAEQKALAATQQAVAAAQQAREEAQRAREEVQQVREEVQQAREVAQREREEAQREREVAQQAQEVAQQAQEVAQRERELAQQAQEVAQRAREEAQQEREMARGAELKLREEKEKASETEHKLREADEKTREAERKGRDEGLAEGEARAKAEMLLFLLHQRYKTLPNDIDARVRTAGNRQLDDWIKRFVDAEKVDDVFR